MGIDEARDQGLPGAVDLAAAGVAAPAGRTEAIVPSVTVTSNGPSTRPAMLSNTLTFVMRSGSCSTIRAFP
jgi:hypothetical protein